jgi:hypothetical protein
MTLDQKTEPAASPTTATVYRPDPRGAAWCVLIDSSGRQQGDTEREELRTALSVYAIAASAGVQSASANTKGRHPYDIERWKWVLAQLSHLDMKAMETSVPLTANRLDLAAGLLPDNGPSPTGQAGTRSALLGALASAADRDLASYPHICLVLEIGVDTEAEELTGMVRLRMTDITAKGEELTCSHQSAAGEFTGLTERQKDRWKQLEAKYATPENLAALRSAKHYAERVVPAS